MDMFNYDQISDLPVDKDKLNAKYIEERELRTKNGGLSQYRKIREPSLSHYLKDGYADSELKRDRISTTYEVVIVGGGYAGLLVAVKLQEQGIEDIAIIEKGSDFGGTWYWNRYPGAQCDVESYIYMPLLEETEYIPKEKYAHAPELFGQAQNIGRRFGLYRKAIFQTEVLALRWSDEAGVWKVETDRGDEIRARWIVPCPGNQSTPKLPGLPGIELFRGASFHTCRWDYSYTGGSGDDGSLHGLRGKRVAVIGTGASAVQVVPRLAEWAEHLYVIQRTPSSVSPRNNQPTDQAWARSLTPGWQRRRMDNFHHITGGVSAPGTEDLVDDAWTHLLRAVAGGVAGPKDSNNDPGTGNGEEEQAEPTAEQLAGIMQLADFKIMEAIRARVDREVCSARDPHTAQALKPWYNLLCKRPCFHDEYLQTFNRDNVSLIDTRGRGVDAVTESGVAVNGRHVELDCIVYATGFEWQTKWTQRTGMQIYGRGGTRITDKWAAGTSTFHGWCVNGFPNLLLVTHAQSGLPVNYTHLALDKAAHIAYVIGTCKQRGIRVVEPALAAEESWVEECVQLGASRNHFLGQCTPGYFNDEGAVGDGLSRANAYQGGPVAYERILAAWRKEDKLEGLLVQF